MFVHSYSDVPPTPYSASPSFISADPHAHSAVEYSSYPGPDPYSAYSADSYSSGPYPSAASSYPSSSYGHNDRSYDTGSSTKSGRKSSSSKRTKRQTSAAAMDYDFDPLELLNRINWGEIAFQFLGVDTMGCRKRFVCEFDFRAARNPFTRMAYTLIGYVQSIIVFIWIVAERFRINFSKNFFDKYRDLSSDAPKATKFTDCARMYRECAAAEEYNDADDAELEAVKPVEPLAADEVSVDDLLNNEVVEYDGDEKQKTKLEAAERSLSDDVVENVHNTGRLILLRAEQ